MVTMEAGKAEQSLKITVSDVTGKMVNSKQFSSIGNAYAQEIDAGKLLKGTYMVVVNADGEPITGMLVLR